MNKNTFLDLSLDRELYKPKVLSSTPKPPLRVLVTSAGSKIAYNLIYKIATGQVFGPDQEIILHLVSSRESINHKTIVLELMECGFSVCKDFVVNANPAIAYKKVDVVIAIATYEEMPGRMISNTFVYQMIKARQTAKCALEYASKDVKLILTGPSTKAVTILLGAFTKICAKFPIENLCAVTYLDNTISKAILASKLKITTDRIKNLNIWCCTHPDTYYTTVRTHAPGDVGDWEMKDVPLSEVIDDESWLFEDFGASVFRRTMKPELVKFGKAVAVATAEHLKVMFGNSSTDEEFFNASVIIPPSKPYGLPPSHGFSFPVKCRNGKLHIIEDLKYTVSTQLNIMRFLCHVNHTLRINSMRSVISFMLDYENTKKKILEISNRFHDEMLEGMPWTLKYFVTMNMAEGVVTKKDYDNDKGQFERRSIIWNDEVSEPEEKSPKASYIKITSEKLIKSENDNSSVSFKILNTDKSINN